MRLTIVKRTVMATALAVATAVAGIAGQAQAFTFGQNDLVLAIYGNNTEALYNLGTYSTLLAAGPNTDLNLGTAGLTATQVGTNAVKWTIFGWDLSLPDGQIHAATAFTPAQITGPLDFTSQFNPSTAWAGGFSGDTVSKGSSLSFSSNLNTAGAGKFEGAWPVAMQGFARSGAEHHAGQRCSQYLYPGWSRAIYQRRSLDHRQSWSSSGPAACWRGAFWHRIDRTHRDRPAVLQADGGVNESQTT